MPRSTDATLNSLLPACETESIIDIVTRGAEEFHFATSALSLTKGDYTNNLLRVGELKESGGQETNRVNVRVSNETDAWGIRIASQLRTLELATVVIQRFFSPINDRANYLTKHFFSGKLINAETVSEIVARDPGGRATLIKKYVSFDVIPKTTASGLSIASRTLSPSCAWVFKDINCQDGSGETDCNHQLKSKEGCMGRGNFSHNGGFTFPETPTQGLPSSSGGGVIGGGHCFPAGTLVFTPRGYQPIEKLQKYWRVYSFDPKTLSIEVDTIKETFRHTVSGYFEFTFSDGSTLKVTPEHRFLDSRGNWIRADEFEKGETLLWRRARGGWQKLTVTEMAYRTEIVSVYNIHVLRNHNYLPEGFAVHNAKSPDDL